MQITFPRIFSLNRLIAGNNIQQIGEDGFDAEGTLTAFSYGRRSSGLVFHPNAGNEILILPKKQALPETHERILASQLDPAAAIADLTEGIWLRHPLMNAFNEAGEASPIRKMGQNFRSHCTPYRLLALGLTAFIASPKIVWKSISIEAAIRSSVSKVGFRISRST